MLTQLLITCLEMEMMYGRTIEMVKEEDIVLIGEQKIQLLIARTLPRDSLMEPAQRLMSIQAYGPLDFHCERGLNSWTDPFQLNYGWLTGLCDLDTES